MSHESIRLLLTGLQETLPDTSAPDYTERMAKWVAAARGIVDYIEDATAPAEWEKARGEGVGHNLGELSK